MLLGLGSSACTAPEGLDAESDDAEFDDDASDEAASDDADLDDADLDDADLDDAQSDPYDPDASEPIGLTDEVDLQALTNSELSQLLMNGNYTVTSTHNPIVGGHNGMDFGGTGNGVTTVYSPVTGTVLANTTSCGKVAIFDGSNTVILAHMTQLSAPAVGSAISIGTAVGKASDVVGGGCSVNGGAHLHIEIRTGQNSTMASLSNNNTATTRDPLTYGYSGFKAVTQTGPVSGTVTNANPVNFSWAAQPGANLYRLQISTSSAFTAESCSNTCTYNTANSSTSRAVALNPGTYYWRVRAGNSGQGGYWSTVRSLTKQ